MLRYGKFDYYNYFLEAQHFFRTGYIVNLQYEKLRHAESVIVFRIYRAV